MYIHERDNWTNFRWDASEVSNLQEIVCRKQGLLYGRLSSLGFDSKPIPMTERQTQMLNLFLDGYEAKITPKTWATLAKCSKDTAIRDIQDLVSKNILVEDIPGAKRPSYSIVFDAEDLTLFFTDVCVTQENGIP